MTIESKEKALPGYKSLAEVQKKQISILEGVLEESRISNYNLGKLNKTESKRLDLDILSHELVIVYRKRASRATWMQVFVGVAALTLAVITFWSGAAVINRDNPAVIMITDAVKTLLRGL